MTPKKLIAISLTLLNLLSPLSVLAQATPQIPASCRKIGVNSAAYFAQGDQFYQHSQDLGFGWTLEIATYAQEVNQSNPTVQGINRALAAHLTPVVRIGIGASSGGFIDPAKYALFLNKVADQVNDTFYAIAGPNEPEFEHWIAQEVGDDYTSGEPNNPNTASIAKAGHYLANYMNALLDANLDSKIKLLSPSYTLTSWASDYFIDATIQAGGRFNELDGFSGTSYSGQMGADDMVTHIRKVTQRFPNLPIVFTEYHDGDGNADLTTLKADIDLVRTDARAANVIGALLFNAFNTNTGWSQFALDDNQLALVLPAECLTNLRKITIVRPIPRPSLRPCTTEDKPEFHPLRPYPGEPCDPLIPRSKPAANYPIDSHSGLPPNIPLPKDEFSTQLAKDYQLRNSVAFACGKSITPNTPEQFDTALGRAPDLGSRGKCELSGKHVTCYIKEKFGLTLDLTDANIPILGNTQTGGMTDAQKMTEYLSWFLNGTVQQSEQEPNPSINRLVNFSGPLQKLLPFDIKNAVRSWLVEGPVGEKFQPPSSGGQYHNYIVGCQKDVNLWYVIEAANKLIAATISGLSSFAANAFYFLIPSRIYWPYPIPITPFAYDIIDLLLNHAEIGVQLAQTLETIEPSDLFKIADLLDQVGKTELAQNLVSVGQKNIDHLRKVGELINAINLDVAVSCKDSDEYIRLKEFKDHLPPDPAKYDNFKKYWDDYIWWRGMINVPIIGPVDFFNQNIWAQLFQNISFSSLEDATGEVVISISDNYKHANMQDKDVVEGNAHPIDNAVLKLIIKAKP